jgi:hypothetical protein
MFIFIFSKVRQFTLLWIILGVLLMSGTAVAAPTANPGDILIIEVNADPASTSGFTEPSDEFIELYNNSGVTINLNGWTLTDNSITTITLPNILYRTPKFVQVAQIGERQQ